MSFLDKFSSTLNDFIPHLIIHPDEAEEEYRSWVWLASVVLGIFTCGLIHGGCALYEYFSKNAEVKIESNFSEKEKVTSEAARKVLQEEVKSEKLEKNGSNLANPNVPLPSVSQTALSLSLEKDETPCKASISIHPVVTGYFGDPRRRDYLPKYLKQIYLEDGTQLPLASNAVAVNFWVYNMTKELKDLRFPEGIGSFYLPASLFIDKNEGDSIRLKFKSQLIELKIQQVPNTLPYTPQEFKPLLKSLIDSVKNEQDIETSLFCRPKLYWWYSAGEKGSLFRLKVEKHENFEQDLRIEEVDKSFLRHLGDPEEIRKCNIFTTDKSVIYQIPFLSFKPEDVDIILNERYLIFFGATLNALPMVLNKDIQFVKKESSLGILGSKREVYFRIRWDRESLFKGMTLELMKKRLEASTMGLEGGILTVTLPNNLY